MNYVKATTHIQTPNPNRLVVRGRRDVVVVGRPRNVRDALRVPRQRLDNISSRCVPYLDQLVRGLPMRSADVSSGLRKTTHLQKPATLHLG